MLYIRFDLYYWPTLLAAALISARNGELDENVEARVAEPAQGDGLTGKQDVVVETKRRIGRRRRFVCDRWLAGGILFLGETLGEKKARGAIRIRLGTELLVDRSAQLPMA